MQKLKLTPSRKTSVSLGCIYDYESKENAPLPTDFDTFIPWVCSQWYASTTVVVTRLQQEDYTKIKVRTTKRKSKNLPKYDTEDLLQTYTPSSQSSVKTLDVEMNEDVVPIKAYYNSNNQLVEVSIIGCSKISRKVIQAISLSIPYHQAFNRLTIRKGGLDSTLIYDIHKLMVLIQHSNITEICFDDSYVEQGNYYILLEQTSQLKSLSLNRCEINDEICVKIALNLKLGSPAANSLQILELGSNNISDSGAQTLANMLRTNRCLLHINLSNNRITDLGFMAILNTLMEFCLTSEECDDRRRRTFRYLQNKVAVYEECLEDLLHSRSDEEKRKKLHVVTSRHKHRKHKKAVPSEVNLKDQEENLTLSIVQLKDQAENFAVGKVGQLNDPFSPKDVVVKQGVYFSKGNLKLCSLNMAYNDLAFPSVRKLYDVVLYQADLKKMKIDTGLMRVTLDGNYIPKTCMELDVIDDCLTKVITRRVPSRRRTRGSSTARRLLQKQQTSFQSTPK